MDIDETTTQTTNRTATETAAATLAETWCRMWNDDPALAHELMTDDCVQWSANTPGLDTVVGPAQQERFISAYRTEHVNIFRARTLIVEGERFAYLWDVTLPDGTTKTGVDVNVLQGGLVRENWTFVADGYRDDADPAPGTPGDSEELRRSAVEWAGQQGHTVHRSPVVDTTSGRVAVLRMSDGVGGVDLLTVRDGVVEPIWSITGVRGFRY